MLKESAFDVLKSGLCKAPLLAAILAASIVLTVCGILPATPDMEADGIEWTGEDYSDEDTVKSSTGMTAGYSYALLPKLNASGETGTAVSTKLEDLLHRDHAAENENIDAGTLAKVTNLIQNAETTENDISSEAQDADAFSETAKPELPSEEIKTEAEEAGVTAETTETAETERSGESESEISADPYHVYRAVMPLGSTDQVQPAKDCGVCRSGYLSGTDSIPEADGIFAENGEFCLFQDVDDSYFSDALFIGDSRTNGLFLYGDMKDVTSFFAKESMSVYSVMTKSYPLYEMGSNMGNMTLPAALARRQYRKIYICLGVNELGNANSQAFYEKYKSILEQIRAAQPDAIIFIQGIMHVSAKKSSSDPVFNNTNIVEKNYWLKSLANGHDIFYIDMNAEYCDESGDLRAESSGDGIHLKASYYAAWHNYLLKKGIVRCAEDYPGQGDADLSEGDDADLSEDDDAGLQELDEEE